MTASVVRCALAACHARHQLGDDRPGQHVRQVRFDLTEGEQVMVEEVGGPRNATNPSMSYAT